MIEKRLTKLKGTGDIALFGSVLLDNMFYEAKASCKKSCA